jgi:5'-deoxy-5'-methylthioadenosine phosphorylase
MSELAIIGGTGLTTLKDLEITGREVSHTPYGEPSAPITHGKLNGKEVLFLPRHGSGHTIPPHKINYRANIYALHDCGVKNVIAVNAVGGIRKDLGPTTLVLPDQIIDYTWSRVNTFFEEGLQHVTHIDFTEPYCPSLRDKILASAKALKLDIVDGGTYAATQGPRLETAAEINRLERDGCDIVGMTGMPEAGLARELGLCYANISVVANFGAGRGSEELTMEMIEKNLNAGMSKVRELLAGVITQLD